MTTAAANQAMKVKKESQNTVCPSDLRQEVDLPKYGWEERVGIRTPCVVL